MKLSIVTINYNDEDGLRKTLESVANQAIGNRLQAIGLELEHIIIDGASTDGSVDVIRDYESSIQRSRLCPDGLRITNHQSSIQLKWISEPDKGIYNAMNKGIKMASGDYIQILNSGDILASEHVVADCSVLIDKLEYPEIIYGNMLTDNGEGSMAGSKAVEYSLRQYYSSTLNHDCCWIKRSLFDIYGLYDENLKIVSDWKWWVQAIGLGHVTPVYVDIDMTIFEGGGISSIQLDKRNQERRQVLEEIVPPAILADYDKHAFDMQQMDNLRKHPWAYKLVWTLERVLNRIDNRNFSRRKIQ